MHFWITEITGKRLELLREMIPTLKRVVTFYNPTNPSAVQSVKEGQRAAQSLGLELAERHVSTPEELRAALEVLKLGDMDAYVAVADAMVDSNAGLIIEMAKTKKLPTMFYEESLTVAGGLASYSADFHEVGRLSAKIRAANSERSEGERNPRRTRYRALFRHQPQDRPAAWARHSGLSARSGEQTR